MLYKCFFSPKQYPNPEADNSNIENKQKIAKEGSLFRLFFRF